MDWGADPDWEWHSAAEDSPEQLYTLWQDAVARHERGLFVSVDGPGGAGKSTSVAHLAQMLVAAGERVHVTAEPSDGPIGVLCRELTESVTGHAHSTYPR